MDNTEISSPVHKGHLWQIVLVIILVVVGLFLWKGGTSLGGPSEIEKEAMKPSPNQGVVTEEERANIEMLRHAPPTEEAPSTNSQ